jgi:hypothetical protein
MSLLEIRSKILSSFPFVVSASASCADFGREDARSHSLEPAKENVEETRDRAGDDELVLVHYALANTITTNLSLRAFSEVTLFFSLI